MGSLRHRKLLVVLRESGSKVQVPAPPQSATSENKEQPDQIPVFLGVWHNSGPAWDAAGPPGARRPGPPFCWLCSVNTDLHSETAAPEPLAEAGIRLSKVKEPKPH